MTHSSYPTSGTADDTLDSQYGSIGVEGSGQSGGDTPLADAGRRTADTAGQLAERAANTGIQQVDRGREQTADGLTQLASSIRRASDDLSTQAPFMQNITQTVAEQTERVASYLRETDTREIIGNVENMARRQPLVFLGGAFLLGLVGARVLKMAAGGQNGGQSVGGYQSGYGIQGGYGETATGYGSAGSGYGSNTGYSSLDTPTTPAGSTEI